jgi:hypothetical protein
MSFGNFLLKRRLFLVEEFMGFVGWRRWEEFTNKGGDKVENEESENEFSNFRILNLVSGQFFFVPVIIANIVFIPVIWSNFGFRPQ